MQTNRYERGKIYAIKSYLTEQVYVGSTCEINLSSRMAQHRSGFRKYTRIGGSCTTSRLILQHGDAYIELLELFPCNTKDELLKREGHHIRNTNCVNKIMPGRTPLEYRIDNAESIKQWRIDNAESIKQWRIDNDAYIKQCRINNAESIKQWRTDNAESIKIKSRRRVHCSYCYNTFTYGNKSNHIKSLKHNKNYKKSYLECFDEVHTGVLDLEDY